MDSLPDDTIDPGRDFTLVIEQGTIRQPVLCGFGSGFCDLGTIGQITGQHLVRNDSQVAVFRIDDDRIYAIANHDPFSKANVLSRGIVGDLKGELVVASPVYKQHFSLATGQCVEDAEVKVEVFPARVANGMVQVEA